MQTLDFSPFYRSTVGFDRLFTRLDTLVGQEAKSYPPYNIERVDEGAWQVSVAVAGFADADLSIEAKENNLSIRGTKGVETDSEDRDFLHRGIAERDFELRFQLGDYVEVAGASLENGLLTIDLKLDVPESKKARQIAINGASGKKTLTGTKAN